MKRISVTAYFNFFFCVSLDIEDSDIKLRHVHLLTQLGTRFGKRMSRNVIERLQMCYF